MVCLIPCTILNRVVDQDHGHWSYTNGSTGILPSAQPKVNQESRDQEARMSAKGLEQHAEVVHGLENNFKVEIEAVDLKR